MVSPELAVAALRLQRMMQQTHTTSVPKMATALASKMSSPLLIQCCWDPGSTRSDATSSAKR